MHLLQVKFIFLLIKDILCFFPNSSIVALQEHGVHVYDKTVYHLRELETKI